MFFVVIFFSICFMQMKLIYRDTNRNNTWPAGLGLWQQSIDVLYFDNMMTSRRLVS